MGQEPIVCPQCGRNYAWKSELAGRKVRCACGTTLTVPAAASDGAGAGDDGLDRLADPVALPASTRRTPPVATAIPSAQPATLAYGSAASAPADDDEPLSPARDLHIPLALLLVGFLGVMLWAYVSEGGKVAAIVYSVLTAVTTAIKAAVIIILALMIARANDVSFGPVRRAVLKFAGIIAFADAVAFWFDWLLEQIGLLPHGYTTVYAIALSIIITGVMIGFLCRMLFDMDH